MKNPTGVARARARTALAFMVALAAASAAHVIVSAQEKGGGQNVSVITGSEDQFTGDRFRQRQNESMIGISGVNSSHMMVVYNDARTVNYRDDLLGVTQSPAQGFVAKVLDFFRLPWLRERGRASGWQADGPAAQPPPNNQAWIGMSFTDNGGKSWYTGLLPGNYGVQIPPPHNGSLLVDESVQLKNYAAANDPVIAATHKQFFVGGIAFNLPPCPPGASPACVGGNGKGIGLISRFTDYNDTETGQNIRFDGTKVLLKPCSVDPSRLCTRSEQFVSTAGTNFFVDKPNIAAAPKADGTAYVYAAFVVFDTSDPNKLSSKILFFRSTNSGEDWSDPVTVSQPLTRNQAPWILVDPNNPLTVYIGWRVFANPLYPNLTNAIVGKRSGDGGATFGPSVPYGVALLLKAFDQPQGDLRGNTLPSPRSAAYPAAAIDGNGAIHLLMQEYVYPSNYATSTLRGRPLGPAASPTIGVPRITSSTSFNQGATWTPRRAIDLGNGTPTSAGTQFMPTITAVGEPGPSCDLKTGPRSKVIAMFYDARASGIGIGPSTSGGIVSGGDKQFDVRVAQASACSANAATMTGLSFSPSEQVSQYTRSSTRNPNTGQFEIVKTDDPGSPLLIERTNRAFPTSCTGNCAFSGDYNHVIPRNTYVKRGNDWKLTTATSLVVADYNTLPAPVVQAVWADTRDVILPTTPRQLPLVQLWYTAVDALGWDQYAAPGSGAVCTNPGSRDQNIYTAEYTPGGLFASAPVTFKSSAGIPRAYPLYVENRTGQSRSYLVTILDGANVDASLDYVDFDPNVPPFPGDPNTMPPTPPRNGFGRPYAQQQAIAIGPISSVTGTVVVGRGVSTPIAITVEETNVQAPAVPAKTTVMLNPAPAGGTPTETYVPVVAPDPIVTKPFGTIPSGGKQFNTSTNTDPIIPTPTPFSPNPFSPNPFSPNPFSPNPFSPNPFSPNPFSPNPFSPNAFPDNTFPNNVVPPTVIAYDVTDISYVVTNEGEQTAAFAALTKIQNAEGLHVVQVLLNRAVPANTLVQVCTPPGSTNCTCEPADTFRSVPISTFGTPFSPNPFSPNPFSPNPFSPNPFSPNPFSPNPFSPNAVPSELSNATFYVKPAQAGGGGIPTTSVIPKYVADPTTDFMVVTYRDFLLTRTTSGGIPLSPQNVTFTVKGEVPKVVTCETNPLTCPNGTRYDPIGPPTTGTQIAHHLEFIVQPTSTSAGAAITPAVTLAIRDTFGATVANSTLPVTIAIASNPPAAGTLSGTLTKNAVNGVATFDNLSIDTAGTGYILKASSGTLASALSQPFNITQNTILIYGTSLAALEGPVTKNEKTIAEAAGYTVDVKNEAEWTAMTKAQFKSYKAIVFADPDCKTSPNPTLDTAEANRTTWSQAVTETNGAIVVVGTDPIFHLARYTDVIKRDAAERLMRNSIDFAASGPGTGLYMNLSCYYTLLSPEARETVTVLDQIGPLPTSFKVGGQEASAVTILDPSHPVMSGLTNESLSGWGSSMHEWFDSYPTTAGWKALAKETSGTPADRIYIIANR